jgi:hypothetical protein
MRGALDDQCQNEPWCHRRRCRRRCLLRRRFRRRRPRRRPSHYCRPRRRRRRTPLAPLTLPPTDYRGRSRRRRRGWRRRRRYNIVQYCTILLEYCATLYHASLRLQYCTILNHVGCSTTLCHIVAILNNIVQCSYSEGEGGGRARGGAAAAATILYNIVQYFWNIVPHCIMLLCGYNIVQY